MYAGCSASARDPAAVTNDDLPDAKAPRDAAKDRGPDAVDEDGGEITEEPDTGSGDDAGEEDDASSQGDGSGADGSVTDGSASDSGTDTGPVVPTPTVDGVISTNEYGSHVNGQNQATMSGATWYMTWTATHLHIAVANATLSEGMIVYLAPSAVRSDAGTNASGSAVGQKYDGKTPNPLPFRARYVVYAKDSYNDARTWDGAAWSAPVISASAYASAGNTREISIPWSSISGVTGSGALPSEFTWLGYVTTGAGFMYAAMPNDNPAGNVPEPSEFFHSFKISDTTPGTGTKPFSIIAP